MQNKFDLKKTKSISDDKEPTVMGKKKAQLISPQYDRI